MQQNELIPHLFRTEYRKIVSVLSKSIGFDYLEVIEDIVSDTFLIAAETWGQKGIPNNPAGWIQTVAKNKTIDYLRRKNLFDNKVAVDITNENPQFTEIDFDLSDKNILDSQLQMMFTICHPTISAESQIGLALNILCGFGVEEIAEAFLTNKDTIYKRLARAKEKLKSDQIKIEFPIESEIPKRLENVLTTLYLLFSEGYYSTTQNSTLRKDFCLEAMRLNLMLINYEKTNLPATNALLSLMCFHASRFDARVSSEGEIILMEDQDKTLWNKELIEKGNFYLNQSSTGTKISKYHLEAGIAYWHATATNDKLKWENILQLYNKLLQIEYSPIAALNRTYALAKANNLQEAIKEAEKLKLNDFHLYHCLLGNFYRTINKKKAIDHYSKALTLSKSLAEKNLIREEIKKLEFNI